MPYTPHYERPRTPPPTSAGPFLPHKPGQEWDTPIIARVRQLRDEKYSATDIKRLTGVPARSQRKMMKQHGDRRRGRTSNRGRPPKIDEDTVHKMQRHIQGRYKKLSGAEARQGLLNDIGIWIGRVRSIYKTKDEEEKERKRSRAGKCYTPRS